MRYQPFFCEENIWHLAGDAELAGRNTLVAVISNPARSCLLMGQRAGGAEGYVVWDYHVVLCAELAGAWEVWDLDATYGCPVSATVWLNLTFPLGGRLPAQYEPLFRVLSGAAYRALLNTDRRHMRAPDGTWRAEPPSWPVIGSGSNLMDFVDMERAFEGEVLDLDALRSRLAA